VKKKKKIQIIKVERTSIDSPLPIYTVDIEINVSITKADPHPSNYHRSVVHTEKKVISIYYFEILENILLPMNVGFITNDNFNMPYNLRNKIYKVYQKLEMKKYINSNSFDAQLEDVIKPFHENEHLPNITIKNGVNKRHGKMELYSPREIEVYLQ